MKQKGLFEKHMIAPSVNSKAHRMTKYMQLSAARKIGKPGKPRSFDNGYFF